MKIKIMLTVLVAISTQIFASPKSDYEDALAAWESNMSAETKATLDAAELIFADWCMVRIGNSAAPNALRKECFEFVNKAAENKTAGAWASLYKYRCSGK